MAYSVMYPGANIVQQIAFRHKHEDKSTDSLYDKISRRVKVVDQVEAARFLVYGTFFHAPLVHHWMRFAGYLFPGTATKQVIRKVSAIINTINVQDNVLYISFTVYYIVLNTKCLLADYL